MVNATPEVSLEKQFLEQSHRHNISVARLKAVYFRGVEDFYKQSIDMGSASMWGLVRVQKYINAMKNHDFSQTDDKDLCTPSSLTEEVPDPGLELSSLTAEVVFDVIYGNGSNLSTLFHPGVVESVVVDDNRLYVSGAINDEQWHYELDMLTGSHDLSFQSR